MTYFRPDIVVNEEQVTQDAYDVVAARVPGWQPAPGTLDTAILEAGGRLAAELRRLAVDMADLLVQGLATSVFGYVRRTADSATVSATFTLTAAASGFVVPAGTTFALTAPDGSLTAFDTTVDSTTVGTVATADAVAVVAGAAGNGLSGTATMIDAVPEVAAVVATTTSAGGADDEAEEAYLDRIVRHMSVVAEHPIVPDDFAAIAVDVEGVYRAMAIDGYDPVANTTGNARMVAVIVQNAAGQPVGGLRTNVADLLQGLREVGFVVNVADPVYTNLTVAATIVVEPFNVGAQIAADVQAALADYLSPATWGGPPPNRGGEPPEEQPMWASRPVVYVNQLIAVAGNVTGVERVVALTINGAAADVTLGGGKPHALPNLTAPPAVTWS